MKFIINLFLLACVASLYSCDKERVYPRVELISAQMTNNDSVVLVARLSEFDEKLGANVGFAFHTDSTFRTFMPFENENHVLTFYAEESDFKGSFHTNLFNPQNTYYFKAFVKIGKLYIESNVLQLSGIETQPVDAPCEHPENRYRSNNGIYYQFYSYNSVDVSSMTITYMISGGVETSFYVTASSPPTTGIYTTTTAAVPGPNELRLRMFTGMSFVSYAPAGGLLYVNQIDNNRFRIVACALPFQFTANSLTSLDMNMRLTYQ